MIKQDETLKRCLSDEVLRVLLGDSAGVKLVSLSRGAAGASPTSAKYAAAKASLASLSTRSARELPAALKPMIALPEGIAESMLMCVVYKRLQQYERLSSLESKLGFNRPPRADQARTLMSMIAAAAAAALPVL
jgi:hypothetical protein